MFGDPDDEQLPRRGESAPVGSFSYHLPAWRPSSFTREALREYLSMAGPSASGPQAEQEVIERLQAASERPLSNPHAPRLPGLYALYLGNRPRPIYIGKAGGRRGVEGRLADHLATLRLHKNVDPAVVRCRYVLFGRRAPLAHLEAILIRHFRPEWNRLVGFGSGRSRDGLPPIGRWEERYPRKAPRAAEAWVPDSPLEDASVDGPA